MICTSECSHAVIPPSQYDVSTGEFNPYGNLMTANIQPNPFMDGQENISRNTSKYAVYLHYISFILVSLQEKVVLDFAIALSE